MACTIILTQYHVLSLYHSPRSIVVFSVLRSLTHSLVRHKLLILIHQAGFLTPPVHTSTRMRAPAIYPSSGSVFGQASKAPTKGGTEHGEVYIPAIIKIQRVHFNIIWPSRNDSWCPFSRPMWCSGRKTLAL